MKSTHLSLIALITFSVAAGPLLRPTIVHADPGEERAIQGTLVAIQHLASGDVAVVRDDEGTVYFAELLANPAAPTITPGERVTLFGREGLISGQLQFAMVQPESVVEPGPVVAQSEPAQASPTRETEASGPQPAAAEASEGLASPRTSVGASGDADTSVRGLVNELSSGILTLTSAAGQTMRIDISRVDAGLRSSLAPGQEVWVLASGTGETLIAHGLVLIQPAPPPSR